MEFLIVAMLLIAIAGAFVVWYRKITGLTTTQEIVIGKINGSGAYPQEVVGESFYQDNLEFIVAATGQNKGPWKEEAILRMENDNEHDNQAVAVFIRSKKVGHLSREDARLYRKTIAANGFREGNYSVKAKIFGGGEDFYGVWLDIQMSD